MESASVPVVAYQIANIKWLGIPWTVVALLGTATAFIVGFKNLQTYNRTWEARQIWGDIMSSSRAWGTMSRDFFDNAEKSKELVYRHLAWLTALRYQLRENRAWEGRSGISSGNKVDVSASRIFLIRGNMQPSIPFSSNCSAYCFPSDCSGNSTNSMKASKE